MSQEQSYHNSEALSHYNLLFCNPGYPYIIYGKRNHLTPCFTPTRTCPTEKHARYRIAHSQGTWSRTAYHYYSFTFAQAKELAGLRRALMLAEMGHNYALNGPYDRKQEAERYVQRVAQSADSWRY
jgi:hypothetical protein